MIKEFCGRRAGLLLCACLAMAGLSGCAAYKEIDLTNGQETVSGREAGDIKRQNGGEAAQGESAGAPGDGIVTHSVTLEDERSAMAADGEAVADVSSLDSGITMANGFTEVDETVVITQDLVNVRAGCGTEYEVVTQLNRGDSVKRTGYSDGWSRILYKDRTCYVLSEFVMKAGASGPADGWAESVSAFENGEAAPARSIEAPAAFNGRIIAIDAGHQTKANPEKEPIGPGSSTMKAKVEAGGEGVSTGIPEYKLTLAVAFKVKRILEERGYQVVMIRESNDVNLSNAKRAEMANRSGASVLVRIHANSLDNATVHGTLSMCQTANNPYNGDLHSQSYSLSKKVTDSICAATGFKNRGVQETDTMSCINWSEIPVTHVEMGFMSNPEEDQKMAQDEYQQLIAGGVANGIDAYFAE